MRARKEQVAAETASWSHIWAVGALALLATLLLFAPRRWAPFALKSDAARGGSPGPKQVAPGSPGARQAPTWVPRRGTPHGHCASHAVPPPPALPPDVASAAAPVLELLRALGTVAVMEGNQSATDFLLSLSREQRERIAYEVHTVALYAPGETAELRGAEEAGALRAAPGPRLDELNGLNVGAGGRPVHKALLQVDAHRGLHGDAKVRHAVRWAACPVCRLHRSDGAVCPGQRHAWRGEKRMPAAGGCAAGMRACTGACACARMRAKRPARCPLSRPAGPATWPKDAA